VSDQLNRLRVEHWLLLLGTDPSPVAQDDILVKALPSYRMFFLCLNDEKLIFDKISSGFHFRWVLRKCIH